VFDFVPDIRTLTAIFSQATAPTFFLGAVAAFVSLMSTRLSTIVERIKTLNSIAEDDPARLHLKTDVERLRRRARYLNSGISAALRAGMCATLLLGVLFVSEFAGFKYAYGAGLIFVAATMLLGFALFRFAQEARLGLDEADEYH
jgi:hypothetical protein